MLKVSILFKLIIFFFNATLRCWNGRTDYIFATTCCKSTETLYIIISIPSVSLYAECIHTLNARQFIRKLRKLTAFANELLSMFVHIDDRKKCTPIYLLEHHFAYRWQVCEDEQGIALVFFMGSDQRSLINAPRVV